MSSGSPLSELPRLSGWLKKRGDKALMRSLTWKTRFFRQTSPNIVHYYVDKNDSDSKGYFDMDNITAIRTTKEKEFAFELVTSKRVFVLKAANEEERQYWMENILLRAPNAAGHGEAIKKLQTHRRLTAEGAAPPAHPALHFTPSPNQPAPTPRADTSPRSDSSAPPLATGDVEIPAMHLASESSNADTFRLSSNIPELLPQSSTAVEAESVVVVPANEAPTVMEHMEEEVLVAPEDSMMALPLENAISVPDKL